MQHILSSNSYEPKYLHKNRINADIVLDSKAYTLTTGSFTVYFHFSESRFLLPPSHK